MAGFKTWGIYPFNRSAIKILGSKEDQQTSTKEGVAEDNTAKCPVVMPKSFTPEQEALFKRRFEEGYDVYIDKDYIRWIKLNHPELRVVEDLTPATLDNHTY